MTKDTPENQPPTRIEFRETPIDYSQEFTTQTTLFAGLLSEFRHRRDLEDDEPVEEYVRALHTEIWSHKIESPNIKKVIISNQFGNVLYGSFGGDTPRCELVHVKDGAIEPLISDAFGCQQIAIGSQVLAQANTDKLLKEIQPKEKAGE